MKAGANRSDINQIERMTKEGWSCGEISATLQIEEKCVKGFMPKGDFGAKDSVPDETVKKPIKKKRKAKKTATKTEDITVTPEDKGDE